MNPLRRWLLALFVLTIAGRVSGAGDSKVVAADDYSSEAWIAEKQDHKVRFENDGTGREEWAARVRIQSESGLRQWGQIVQEYVAAFDSVEFEAVRVVKPDGTVRTVPSDKVMEVTSPVAAAFPIYSDHRQKHLTVPDLRVGDVLEFHIVRTIHTALAPGQFSFEAFFARTQVVLDETFELDVPRERELRVKIAEGLTPAVTEQSDRRVYRLAHSTAKLAEIEKERKLAQHRRDAPRPDVVVSSFRSWAELGEWYQRLERDRRTVTREISAKAAALTGAMRSDLEKTQAIYDYVATKVRYVAISFGQGAVQPHAASETLANGYGDCKDKHTLLSALLAAAGIEADAALIGTWRDADPDVPYLQFDHMVSAVKVGKEQGYVWLDTTAEVGPFRWLSTNLRGKRALVVPPTGAARLVEAPLASPLPTESRIEVDATLDASGRWSARQRETYRGDFEVPPRIGFRLMPREQWKSQFERTARFETRGRQLIPEAISIDADDPAATRGPFEIRSSYALANLVDLSDNAPVLHLPVAFGYLPPSEDLVVTEGTRLLVEGPWTMRQVVKLELPAGWTITAKDPVSVSEPFGEYRASYAFAGRTLSIERVLTVKTRLLPADGAEAYDRWRARIGADRVEGFVLHPPPRTAAASATEAEKRYGEGLEAYKEREYAKAVESFKKTVELAAEHKDAWDALGRAYLDQRRTDLAIEAFRKQIAVVPDHVAAHRDLARALWTAKRYPEAEASYKKALELEPEDANTYWSLGALYLAQDRHAAALPPLEKAAALDAKNANIQIALGRAHLGLDQDEKAFAAFDAAVMLRPDPPTWNNAAWYLAVAGKRLERAQAWAESAVVTTAARLRSIVTENLGVADIAMTGSLASYWDTLGWILFRRGELEAAAPYLKAAFALHRQGEIADHYRQLSERRPASGTPAGDDLLEIEVPRPAQCTAACSATFFVALASTGKVAGAKFMSGDPTLTSTANALVGRAHGFRFPDAMPSQVVLPGTLACPASGDCRLGLQPLRPGGGPTPP